MKKDNLIKPHIIICDIDGTLAIHNGRSPYEYDKCDTDLLNQPVAMIVKKFLKNNGDPKIIYMSGREDSCKEKTREWLKTNNVWNKNCCELHMRKTGDHRKDSIIKKELFNKHVRDKYYVEFVLDDRLQVCRMWHDLGLPLLRVGDPDADF